LTVAEFAFAQTSSTLTDQNRYAWTLRIPAIVNAAIASS
jgi:hypothetical protein